MNLTKLTAQLIKHEGLKLKPYMDTVGKVTIGVGHNLTDVGLTQDQALYILSGDISQVVQFLTSNCPWFISLDDVRQRAITDLAFDVRDKLLQFTHMVAAIEAKDWPTASAELLNSTFAKETGQRAHDLAQMLQTGQDPQ